MNPPTMNIIAKADSENNKWLPLHIHSEDTAGIMSYLFDNFVSKSFPLICSSDIDLPALRNICVFIARIHDIGKATALFQSRISAEVPERSSKLEQSGFNSSGIQYSDPKKSPHSLAGEYILNKSGCPESISVIIGSHHGIPAEDRKQVSDQKLYLQNYYGDSKPSDKIRDIWENTWSDIYNNAIQKCECPLPALSEQAQMIISGLLIMADWIASSTDYFPLLDAECDGSSVNYEQRIKEAIDRLSLPGTWNPSNEQFNSNWFNKTFGFKPSSLQSEIIGIAQKCNSSGLFILEAPMGCGKTEAALALSEILALKYGKNGLFFGLPTQSTANGIFPRIVKWGNKQADKSFLSVRLAHGSYELNEEFNKIQKCIPQKFSFDDEESCIVAHSWFNGSKRSCLADFVVGTVDQLLMMALKRRHLMLLHLGLSRKVVIIDECHAYDAYMNRYLDRALHWLGMYKTPVILLSATLPAKRRTELAAAYLNLRKSVVPELTNCDYPVITWTENNEIKQQSLTYNGEHRDVSIKIIFDKSITEITEKALKNNGCVGIIVNTVGRAQALADSIRTECNAEVILYHSQFIMPDRYDIENNILSRVGKTSSPKTRKNLVIVGTQVLEQSLDIDFDMLITDLCPMDLLLQRIGRLHRHNRKDRPKELKKAECFVINADEGFESGAEIIYGQWLLGQTLENLPTSIMLPDDISTLVQKVYSAQNNTDEYKKYAEDIKEREQRAKSFLLEKNKGKDIHGLLARDMKDSQAEASVRDGISSVEALVLMKDRHGNIRFLPWRGSGIIPADRCPDEDICRHIAEQKIRLPSFMCQSYNIENTINEIECQSKSIVRNWETSHWLRSQLVLFLDEDYSVIIGKVNLKYDRDYGLINVRNEAR